MGSSDDELEKATKASGKPKKAATTPAPSSSTAAAAGGWGGVYVGPASGIPQSSATSVPKAPNDGDDDDEQRQQQQQSLLRRLSRSKSPKMAKAGKVKCEICKKKCAGDILRADEKYFHIACFACKTCHRPLSEVGFFVQDGGYYCPNDYHAQFGVKCPVCREYVEGNVVECLGQTFHQKCFKCDRCRQPFATEEQVTYTGTEHLCQRCVAIPVAKVKPQQLVQSHTGTTEQQRPISPPQLTSPTVCASCSQLINSGQVLLALDCQWHIWCFKCTTCDSVLHGEYLVKDGKPYCIRDYNAQFGVRCYECDKYIAGKVLQAADYQFHPTCARCSRCGEHFLDGAEMYMQGDEIWHPHCNDIHPPETIVHGHGSLPRPRSPRSSGLYRRGSGGDAEIVGGGVGAPKYTMEFGRHLLYSYLVPEPSMGYLKHPIEPHAPPPQQFHKPIGPVKIRKSRISMLKTGMQRLTEALDETTPRPKSPFMDNEEPIEMAHYPGGHAPNPDDPTPIERDDFPAPPYPYAVEELKRRLSSSDLEDAEDDMDGGRGGSSADELEFAEKAEEELKKYEKDSSLVHVVKLNLEQHKKKTKLPLHWDPRSASRTPSGKKMPHLKCRYETPINASPSRYMNRPKPWVYWEQDRSATTMIPYFDAPKPGYGLAPKSSTLPAAVMNGTGEYYQLRHADDMNATIDSRYSVATKSTGGGGSAGSTLGRETTFPAAVGAYQTVGGPGVPVGAAPSAIRTSLPDMSKPPKIYDYDELLTSNKKLPEDADRCHLERHLAKDEFEKLFKMTPLEFYKLPDWKRVNLKRKVKLF